MEIAADVYLEHHGVKGQKWGIRRRQPKPFVVREKSAIRIAGYTATVFGARAVGKIVAGKTGNVPLAGLAALSTAAVGRHLTLSAVDRYGNRPMVELVNPNVNQEE